MKKLFNILLILTAIFMMPTVYAHDIELDRDDIVEVPLDSKNQLSGSTKVLVDESFGEYDLYYQYVKFQGNEYESFLSIHQAELEYIEQYKPSEDATEQEKQDYYDEIVEYESSKKVLKPGYVEADWIKSTNGTVPFIKENGDEVKEGDPYILWVKAVKKTNSEEAVYDELWVLYNVGMESDEIKNSETSDNILIIGVLLVATLGTVALSYKKVRA